jgi:hypothetical protein
VQVFEHHHKTCLHPKETFVERTNSRQRIDFKEIFSGYKIVLASVQHAESRHADMHTTHARPLNGVEDPFFALEYCVNGHANLMG